MPIDPELQARINAEVRAADKFDDRDDAIMNERMAALNKIVGPRVGDWLLYRDDTYKRVAHVWEAGDGFKGGVQPSAGGSYYLGHGYVSMSGSLDSIVPFDQLDLAPFERLGTVWIFHHNQHEAHNGVTRSRAFRVFYVAP